jgi:hypothetical protein
MFSLKTHAIIFGSIVFAIMAWGVIGNMLHAYTDVPITATTTGNVIFFLGFLTLGLSAVPLMVKLFLAGQVAIGNGNARMIQFMIAHQTAIVFGVWAFFLLGTVMAMPDMIKSGFFISD